MTHGGDELEEKLAAAGRWRAGLQLEAWEWLAELAPPGALDDVAAYRLIDPDYVPERDAAGRDWTPVLDLGGTVLVDPSTQMLDQLLAGSGYFEQPSAFGEMLLLQFHRFALDFYEGYQVRETSFTIDNGELVIRGDAFRGGGRGVQPATFETRAGRDRPTRFQAQASADAGLRP